MDQAGLRAHERREASLRAFPHRYRRSGFKRSVHSFTVAGAAPGSQGFID
jgi:hypothetical protein